MLQNKLDLISAAVYGLDRCIHTQRQCAAYVASSAGTTFLSCLSLTAAAIACAADAQHLSDLCGVLADLLFGPALLILQLEHKGC